MEQTKLVLNVQDKTEFTLREGHAPTPLPLKEPKIINIVGDIHSVSSFLKARSNGFSLQQVDKDRAIVTCDKVKRSILLELDPENYYGASVMGKLELSPELLQFHINEDQKFDRKQLSSLVKFTRFYFEDKAENMELLNSLAKVRMKSESEIAQESDNKGNKKNALQVTIDSGGLKEKFTLTVPIFKGFPSQKVEVEICYDIINNQVCFWLESVGLLEAIDSQIDMIFSAELESCEGFVIIYK